VKVIRRPSAARKTRDFEHILDAFGGVDDLRREYIYILGRRTRLPTKELLGKTTT
jgi:hypothetical protein